MKKTIYTIAFIALFSVISNAQTQDRQANSAEPVKVETTVNPDGTISPSYAPAAADKTTEVDKGNNQGAKGGTRMAITEKGVPASKKSTENKKTETPKSEK